MKTDWDYTSLAQAYTRRPPYSEEALDEMLAKVGPDCRMVCDVGAGTAMLTRMLAARGRSIIAIEPNAAMRRIGAESTASIRDVRWVEATGEATGQADATFDMVTFGSSFNVCDRPRALQESARILKPGGWIACLWNHRRLNDRLQAQIERIIREQVPGYSYGARREDQAPIIAASGRFGPALRISVDFALAQTITDCVAAWRSHATLARQAGERFFDVVALIERMLRERGEESLLIPYTTVVSMARRAAAPGEIPC